MVHTKEIAARCDVHPKTFKRRWIALLGVPPDQTGHGSHKWTEANADEIVRRFNAYYTSRGMSAELARLKFSGLLTDRNQPPLPFTFDAKQIPQKNQKTQAVKAH